MIKFYNIEEIKQRPKDIVLSFDDVYINRCHVGKDFSKLQGIYIWFNDINDDIYIGSTDCFHFRINSHTRNLYIGNHKNWKFLNAFKTLGSSHFYVEIYPIADISRNDLFDIETDLIVALDSVKHGYNLITDSRNKRYTEEEKQKLSKKFSDTNKNKSKSLEQRKKCGISISKVNRGAGNPNTILTKNDILYIRSTFTYNMSDKYCAEFNITPRCLRNIIHLRSFNYPDYIPDNYTVLNKIGSNNKLSKQDILFIRNNVDNLTMTNFCNKFNVDRHVISSIIHLRTYKEKEYVPDNYVIPKHIKSKTKKLNEKDILWLRTNYKNYSLKELCVKFNVKESCIIQILYLYRWLSEDLIPDNYQKPDRKWRQKK